MMRQEKRTSEHKREAKREHLVRFFFGVKHAAKEKA
jgi:hypothetical protein